MSKTLEKPVAYKSPLYEMTQTTPTCLWNDSATSIRVDLFDRAWCGGCYLQSCHRARRAQEGSSSLE